MKGVAAERKTDKCSNNIGANTGGINQEKLSNKKVYIGFENIFWGWWESSWTVEGLFSMHKAPGSMPSIAKQHTNKTI